MLSLASCGGFVWMRLDRNWRLSVGPLRLRFQTWTDTV